MAVLERVKKAMAITSTTFDDDLQGLIDAGKKELSLAGVTFVDDAESLTAQAIVFYCKAYFRADSTAEYYLKAFNNLKIALSLAGDDSV